MKSSIVSLLLLLLFPIMGKGQVSREFVLHFNENDFIYKTDDNGQLYILSHRYFVSYQTDCQSPALPMIRINYLIEDSDSYGNVSILAKDELVFSDVVIAPNPKYVQTSVFNPSSVALQIANYEKDSYPENNIEYTGTHQMGGYKYASFLVCPFRYDAINKCLYIKKDITMIVETETAVSSISQKLSFNEVVYKDRSVLPTLRSLVINKEDVDSIYEESSGFITDLRASNTSSSTGYEYLIITNNALKTAFQDLAEWKTLKGIRSTVLTTENISTQYTGSSLESKIKRVLKDYYNGTYSGLKYVLLGGDVNIVPSRMCYIKYCNIDTVYDEGTTPTDMFYACFDGNFEWNENGNSVYGEEDDNVDLAPEIVVTRVPVSTSSEASSFVNRIINYERDPITSNWKKNVLMGGHVLKYWCYGQYSDAEIKADSFYYQKIQPYWTGERSKLFNTYSGDSAYIFNPTTLQEKLAEGFSFVDITTHGLSSGWSMRETDWYGVANAQNLENTGRTIITTVACHTNSFDDAICLSEAFIRNANSGILGYIGCSRQGWLNVWPWLLGPSFDFNGEFYKWLFTNTHKEFGKTIIEAKAQFVGSCSNYYSPYRWILFGLNPLGDPEMAVYIDTPQRFDNMRISYSNGALNVTTGVSGCKICVSGTNYYEVQYGTTASFSNVLDGYCICVTKPGYIPVVATIKDSVYLQNTTITGDNYIVSKDVYGGCDVTTTIPQGSVTIQNGNVEIYGTNEVLIKNDFEVQSGASLKIVMGE